MLPVVKNTLMKADLFEAMLDNGFSIQHFDMMAQSSNSLEGMITAISEWLAPLPDKSLPALEIRSR
jgi:hypothetical protein